MVGRACIAGFTVFIFSLEEVVWNQKFGCLQHAVHTPVPLHNSQSAMALLHGYPLGLFDHRSGPARYVTNRRRNVLLTGPQPENGLRVRAPSDADARQTLQTTSTRAVLSLKKLLFFLFVSGDHRQGRSKKLCRPPIHEDPGSASQQSECNDPAPH